MATTDITLSVEDLVEGDEIVAYSVWNFDTGTRAVTGSWTVDSVYWKAANRLADVYTDGVMLMFSRGEQVTVRRETTPEAAAETVEQGPTKGERFAKMMRYYLSIGTRTRRNRKGTDLHREIAELIVMAAMQRGSLHPDLEATLAPAFDAACSWVKDIKGGRGSWMVIEHINQMSPWRFCNLLGDMVDAGVTTTSAGAQYFAQMRTELLAQAA